jgi:glycosidase
MHFLQAGVPFIYQGQEIGVTNSWYTDIHDFNDIETYNFYNMNPLNYSPEDLIKFINFGSRDNARRPMPWDDSQYGDFGVARPWIPMYTRYKEINVKADRESEKSIFKFYQELIRIRKQFHAVRHGVYENITDGRVGSYIYKMTDKETKQAIVVVCNSKDENVISLDLAGECILSNYEKRISPAGSYKPYECAVFTVND